MAAAMYATPRERELYGGDVEIVSREKDHTVYRLADSTGEVVMTEYRVFPGIDLIYNDIHIQSCRMEPAAPGRILEISHCREGRIECEFRDEFYYLSPGDLVVARKDGTGHSSYFPLSHYRGITISIDVDSAPRCLSCILDDVKVCPASLMEKFCGTDRCYVARSQPCIEHIFSELYSVPESIRKGYFKVKILELLLFLSGMDMAPEDVARRSYTRTQVALAKNACQYLTEHMDERITLERLSEFFHVSGTQIKNSFKGVYGISMYSYIRTQKMQAAAMMLRHTDCTILEVAGCFGYNNSSKFAGAFKDVMGMSPNEYRNAALVSTP